MPFILSACLVAAVSATSQSAFRPSESPEGVVLLSAASEAGFSELQTVAERPFEATVSPENGAVALLHGGRFVFGADPAAAAREFLTRFRRAFGLAAEFEPVCALHAGPRPRVHVRFQRDGLDVFGVEAHVFFDELGRIVGARVRGGRGATQLGAFELEEAVARNAARDAIREQRLALGRDDVDEPTEPLATRVWTAVDGGLVPTWRFVYPSDAGRDEAWTIDVDARTASPQRVLRVRDEIERGTGFYPTGTDLIPFKTGKAKASAFKNIAAALAGSATKRELTTWAVKGVSTFLRPQGTPVFARADVIGANGSDVLVPKGKFVFESLGDEADFFDVSNTAFQLESFSKHLKKGLGFHPKPDFSIPVKVNVFSVSGPSAFFSPTAVTGETTTAGVVFTQPVSGPDELDVSRDPTIVAHEWMHAVMHFEGVSSLETSFNPITAVREGVADFFAAAKQKDTVVGRYLEQAYGVPARDFADGEHLDRAYAEASAMSPSDLPNDHRLGEVFAAVLQDVRELEGTKMAERLAFATLPKLARSVAEVSNQPYSVTTAEAITRAVALNFQTALTFAALDLGKSKAEELRLRCAVIGASTARGFINTQGKVGIFPHFVDGLKPKITIHSRIVDTDFALHHVYALVPPAGKWLRVTVRGFDGFTPAINAENALVHAFESNSAKKEAMLLLESDLTGALRVHVGTIIDVPGRYDAIFELVDP